MLADYWLPLSFMLGGLGLGILFELVVLRFLRRTAAETKWAGDDILVDGFRGMPLLWFTLIGIYRALPFMSLTFVAQSFIEKIILLIALLSVMILLERIFMRMVNARARKVGSPNTSIFQVLIRIIVVCIWLVVVFRVHNVSVTPLLTALGVGGLAVALALQDTLSNMFSGLYITASKKIKPGDYLKLETGEEGRVTDITWRDTTIRMWDNNLVVVPNSKLAGETLVNYSLPKKELSVKVEIGVDYKSDLEKVERVLLRTAKQVAKSVDGGNPDGDFLIRFKQFEDFSIISMTGIPVKAYTDQFRVRHEFIKRIHKEFKKERIVIPFPVRTVHMDTKRRAK